MIVSCVSLFYYPLGCCQQTVVRIISLIKLSLYAPTVNKEHVQPVQEWESNTGREIAGYGMYSSQAIWCNARGDSALAKRLSGFTLTWLPLCGLQIGPWEHVLSSSSQLRLKHHRPEDQSDQRLDQRAVTRLPVPWMYLRCGETLSLSCNTPTTSTRYLQKHFMLRQKHQSISVCVRPS